jgi:primosomal protein N' (replication factor Y)
MVTKGLDFPNVTLVGVISADGALNMPDFRAAERTFQLLAQVAGRAGRGEQPGRVLIQTLADDHYAIEAARSQDYEAFVKQELEFRASPPYPPFSHVVNIISQDESEGAARARLDELALALLEAIARENGGRDDGTEPGSEPRSSEPRGTELLGPVDCPLARVKNKFRFHLMLRDRNRPRLHRVLEVIDKLPRESRSGLIVDVDAMALL